MRRGQILDTTAVIGKEAEQFRRKKLERLKKLGVTVNEPDRPLEDINGHAAKPQLAASTTSEAVADIPSPAKTLHEKLKPERPGGHENHHDDAGYVMVENEEDTVIY